MFEYERWVCFKLKGAVIMTELSAVISAAEKIAFDEHNATGMPLKQHIELSRQKAKVLAKQLGANVQIVEVGTLMMDCVIGKAIQAGKVGEHIQMCLDKTNEMLAQFDLDETLKENIRMCVKEHHGATKFHSIESEICCNADCYRFTSIKGFMYAVRFLRDMPDGELVKLLSSKLLEKNNLVSLPTCIDELKPEYEVLSMLVKGML